MNSLKFDLNDQRHLTAAEGWLQLGLHLEAKAELEKIQPQLRSHPDVLELRWHIYAKEKKWDACIDIAATIIKRAPKRVDGWIHRSFALHELQRTQEAFDQLLPAVDQFPKVWTIPYNLACYASMLHLKRKMPLPMQGVFDGSRTWSFKNDRFRMPQNIDIIVVAKIVAAHHKINVRQRSIFCLPSPVESFLTQRIMAEN